MMMKNKLSTDLKLFLKSSLIIEITEALFRKLQSPLQVQGALGFFCLLHFDWFGEILVKVRLAAAPID